MIFNIANKFSFLKTKSGSLWGLTFVVFLIGLSFFGYIYSKIPLLHDGDSYYHLAVARLYAQQGIVDHLDWARYSVMNAGYGDKEFLFHLLLMPFVQWLPPEFGGKIALALLNALIAAAIANLSLRAIGKWGIFVPIWVFGTSAAFALRMSRLRPEILSLLILLAATWAASRNRYRWLLVLSALYALSYTAVHVLIILSIGWFIATGWVYQRWEWRIPVCATIGAIIGLAVHPHFPSNLNIWVIQNIDFFFLKSHLDVGNEIQPAPIATIVALNLGWIFGLVIFWRSKEKIPAQIKNFGPECLFTVNAVAFSLLYLLMQRFSIYCIPFVTLAVFFWIKRNNSEIGRWTYLPFHGRIAFVFTFCLCLCTSVLSAWYIYVNLKDHAVFDTTHRKDWQALGQIIPKGAKVAAPWDATELYVWAAPHGRYLNVLDPIFMAVPYPSAYSIQKKIWDGDEADVPNIVKKHFDSDYIVFPYKRHMKLFWRLFHDPRAKLLFRGHNALFRLLPEKNKKFMVNWKVISKNGELPPEVGEINKKSIYDPKQKNSIGQNYEGYVNGFQGNPKTGCINLTHEEFVDEPVAVEYEFASYGQSSVWLNDKLIIQNLFPAKATLGSGVRLNLDFEEGYHQFSVRTCRYNNQNGFYFLERDRSPLN